MNTKDKTWPFPAAQSRTDDLLDGAAASPGKLSEVRQPDGPNVAPSAFEKEAAEGKGGLPPAERRP